MLRTTNRLSIIACTAAVLGAASPMFAAEPWFQISLGRPVVRHDRHDDWREHRHGRWDRKPEVKRLDEIPCDLTFSAYQTKDRIVVVARGKNRAAGFLTSLTACDVRGRTPELILRNVAPDRCGAQVVTCFEVTTAVQTCERVKCLKVSIGDKNYEVAVRQV